MIQTTYFRHLPSDEINVIPKMPFSLYQLQWESRQVAQM